MKLTLILLAVCFIVVNGETCPGGLVTECVHTLCDDVSELHCVDNNCVCTLTGSRCPNGTREECLAINGWSCPAHRRHCMDQRCVCVNI